MEYSSIIVKPHELDDCLNDFASEGWQLHTCRPFVVDMSGQFLVVMYRVKPEQESDSQEENAIACKN